MRIYAGKLFDPITESLISKQVIKVSTKGIVVDVQSFTSEDENELFEDRSWAKIDSDNGSGRRSTLSTALDDDVVDLRHLTVLPGLVDAHVHFFLHSYAETSWNDQVTQESLAERTVRATVHAKRTLMAGFTSVRDLGTEGAQDADIALRKCLSGPNAMIPGPRYFCANRAIISSGSYGPHSQIYPHKQGIDGISGAEVVDGLSEGVKEVRKQIGTGADWIKLYSDYRVRSRMGSVSSKIPPQSLRTFNDEELCAMINEAHSRRVKVAAHSSTAPVIRSLLKLGVDTIEHGTNIISELDSPSALEEARELFQFWKTKKTLWIPTLSVVHHIVELGAFPKEVWTQVSEAFKLAIELGMENIGVGGDTGAFSHGENAKELVLMRRLGVSWHRILKWATLGGWKCIRGMDWEDWHESEVKVEDGTDELGDNEVPFGALRKGYAADIIGISGNITGNEDDFEAALKNIFFVMKAGKVYKMDGQPKPVE